MNVVVDYWWVVFVVFALAMVTAPWGRKPRLKVYTWVVRNGVHYRVTGDTGQVVAEVHPAEDGFYTVRLKGGNPADRQPFTFISLTDAKNAVEAVQ
jgi:hypothetical protein